MTGLGARAAAGWPSARALLITLSMLVGLVAGVPLPSARVKERLSPGLQAVLGLLERGQAAFLKPFGVIQEEFALTQRWQLFAGANTDRFRIWIEARERRSKTWTLLYRPHDPEHAFLADELEYRRLRGAWNPRGKEAQPGYPAFVTWVSRRIFRERSEFLETRVRIEKIRILPRGRGFEGTGEFLHELTRKRREVFE